jgi:hypothetical protein
MADQLDQKISLIAKLMLVVLSPGAADGEWSNAFEALQRTLKEVDPGGHGLVERIKTTPVTDADMLEMYNNGYRDCAKAIEQQRRNALAVTAPRAPGAIDAGFNGYSWREIIGYCVLNKHRISNDWEANTFLPSVADQLSNPYYELSAKQMPIVRRIFQQWFNGKI